LKEIFRDNVKFFIICKHISSVDEESKSAGIFESDLESYGAIIPGRLTVEILFC
jgi:hypothetical protein